MLELTNSEGVSDEQLLQTIAGDTRALTGQARSSRSMRVRAKQSWGRSAKRAASETLNIVGRVMYGTLRLLDRHSQCERGEETAVEQEWPTDQCSAIKDAEQLFGNAWRTSVPQCGRSSSSSKLLDIANDNTSQWEARAKQSCGVRATSHSGKDKATEMIRNAQGLLEATEAVLKVATVEIDQLRGPKPNDIVLRRRSLLKTIRVLSKSFDHKSYWWQRST